MRSARVIDLSWRRSCAVAALLVSLWAPAAVAQHDHGSGTGELELFLSTEGLAGSGHPHPHDDDSWFNADIVFGVTHDQFRVFGEYFVTPEEHDLERFQVGYEVVPDTVVWLGRFHQPGSAWNTEHHHGRYLQTSITRPSIESWEDEQGLIPQHITGVLLESRRPLGETAGVMVAAGAGAGPALDADGYRPVTLISNNPGQRGTSLTGRVAYLPDYASTSSAGLLFGRDQVYVRAPALLATLQSTHANLRIAGAFVDWTAGAWHLLGVGYYVDIGLDGVSRNEHFMSGYVQAERQLPHSLTAFARIEDSARLQTSRYVALFNDNSGDIDIALRRGTAGLRWDFARRQALSGEISRVVSLDQRAVEVRLQWSAAIP